MTPEEKVQIMNGIVWESDPLREPGGQRAGVTIYGYRARHPDFKFEVYCRDFRSSWKNKEMCRIMFELFLLEVR